MTDLYQQFQGNSGDTGSHDACQFLDLADALPSVRACQQRMLERLALRPGDAVLDLGCGVGHAARRLAAAVGTTGRVVGVDRSSAMIEEARSRSDGPLAPTFLVGDGHRLELPDASFAAARTERVLMYVRDPDAVIAELARVLVPGGRLVCFEFDFDATLIDAPDRRLTQTIVRALGDSLPDGWAGRRLTRRFRAAGLVDVDAETHMIVTSREVFCQIIGRAALELCRRGVLAREPVEVWLASVEPDAGCVGVIASGRKV